MRAGSHGTEPLSEVVESQSEQVPNSGRSRNFAAATPTPMSNFLNGVVRFLMGQGAEA